MPFSLHTFWSVKLGSDESYFKSYSENYLCQFQQKTFAVLVPDFPFVTRGTFGGLIDGGTPLVCGGQHSSDCYIFNGGQWAETFSMNEERFHFAGMPGSPFKDPSHKFYVLAPNKSGTN